MSTIPTEMRKYRITFLAELLGTAPLSKEIYQDWIASRAPKVEDGDEEVEMIHDEKGITGFHRDADGIYILGHMVKGFFKEAGNNLKEAVENPNQPPKVSEVDGEPAVTVKGKGRPKKDGISNLRSKIDNYVFIKPRYIWLKETHDGLLERPIRVMTAKGPRVSLTCSQYVNIGTQIEFSVKLYPNKELSWDLIETLLNYGEDKGLGQWRNADHGSFTWEDITNGGK
jgi:hypothetical protein